MHKPLYSPKKVNWLDRAIQIHNYHVRRCQAESNHTIADTANELERSVGSVSQDLTIAAWVKTHERQLRRFRNLKDALEFIRDKKRESSSQEIEI